MDEKAKLGIRDEGSSILPLWKGNGSGLSESGVSYDLFVELGKRNK